MTPTDRELIATLLRYPEGTTPSEIARMEGIGQSTFYSRLSAAYARGAVVRSTGRGSRGGWAVAPMPESATQASTDAPARSRAKVPRILRVKGDRGI